MGLGRKSMYTSFMAAKSFMSARYTLYLTTLSREDPASSSTSLRFCSTVLYKTCVRPSVYMYQVLDTPPRNSHYTLELTVACLISPVAV